MDGAAVTGTPPSTLLHLVQRFSDHLPSYRSGDYNEAQVRLEFIDPFFEALGWDMFNKQGYAEAYKDVIHEDAIKMGGATKAPDYAFRIGGTRKFFVEAKKPNDKFFLQRQIGSAWFFVFFTAMYSSQGFAVFAFQ